MLCINDNLEVKKLSRKEYWEGAEEGRNMKEAYS